MNSADRSDAGRIEFSGDGRIALAGPLTFESVHGLYLQLERHGSGEMPVESVDLAAVTAADSAGLALLLEWQAQAHEEGRELSVHNAPGALMRLARLCEAVEPLNLSGREQAESGLQ